MRRRGAPARGSAAPRRNHPPPAGAAARGCQCSQRPWRPTHLHLHICRAGAEGRAVRGAREEAGRGDAGADAGGGVGAAPRPNRPPGSHGKPPGLPGPPRRAGGMTPRAACTRAAARPAPGAGPPPRPASIPHPSGAPHTPCWAARRPSPWPQHCRRLRSFGTSASRAPDGPGCRPTAPQGEGDGRGGPGGGPVDAAARARSTQGGCAPSGLRWPLQPPPAPVAAHASPLGPAGRPSWPRRAAAGVLPLKPRRRGGTPLRHLPAAFPHPAPAPLLAPHMCSPNTRDPFLAGAGCYN